MRSWLTAAVVLLLPATQALAQYPAEAIISAPEVEVRAGPSKEFDATSKLRIGDRVFVQRESKNPGWLEITPPPGSFSWIDFKAIRMTSQYEGLVQSSGPAGLRPGSSISNKPPKTELNTVPPGTIVVVLDKPMKHEGMEWLPIRPHVTEVRYIPAEAVKRQAVVQNSTSPVVAPNNPLLEQADLAYRSGDKERAKLLYKEVFDKSTDWNVKAFANNRLQSLSPPTPSPWQPGPGSLPAQTTSASRPPTNTAMYNQPVNPQALVTPPQWSVKGRLRRTTIEKDGQPMYCLESNRGEHLLYVTAAPGLRLRDFEGREIALFGQLVYRSDAYIRTYYMAATHVAIY